MVRTLNERLRPIFFTSARHIDGATVPVLANVVDSTPDTQAMTKMVIREGDRV